MSCFSVPISICQDMESIISNYWWGGCDDKRKIHWTSWDTLCLPKNREGLGFRAMHQFNLALLAKQGWCLLHNDSSLVSKVLKGKYYPCTSFLEAKLSHNCSYTWKSLMAAKYILTDGRKWRVGNGTSIRIWGDNWLSHNDHMKLFSPPRDDISDHFVSSLID